MKKLLFSAGALTTLVAPLAVVVSCGNHSKNVGSTTNGSGTANGSDQGPSSSAPVVEDVIPVDLSKTINATPYSISSLQDEANHIGNHTIWKHGLPYEAATQGISALRAFAEFSGYNSIDFYKTQPDFAIVDENNNVIMPDESTRVFDQVARDAQQKFIDVVKNLKEVSRTQAEKNESTLTIGTIDNDTTSLKTAGVGGVADAELEWSQGKPNLTDGSQVFAYLDSKHPGEKIIQFVNYTHKVVKYIRVKDGNQAYPIISAADESQFKPYIESLFQKFVALFVSASSMLKNFAGYPIEQEGVIEFVQKKYCTNDADGNVVFNMKQSDFDNFWKEFNNGSHNIQALKLLFNGLDSTFASNQDAIDMTRNSNSDTLISSKPTEINSTLEGANSMEIYTFLDWLYESRNVSSTLGHTFYDPSKSLDENIKTFTGDASATTLPKP